MLARFLFFGFLTITPVAILSDLPDRGIPGLFEQGGGGLFEPGGGGCLGETAVVVFALVVVVVVVTAKEPA